MHEIGNFLAVIFVYFAIVYLTAIRRFGQSLLSWSILIAVQSISVWFYSPIYLLVTKKMGIEVAVSKGLILLLLVLLNILLIFAVSIKEAESREKEVRAVDDRGMQFDLQTDDIFLSDLNTLEKNEGSNGALKMTDEKSIFASIEKLIAQNRVEDAKRYLRIVVYYSKDAVATERAKNMLETLHQESKGGSENENNVHL